MKYAAVIAATVLALAFQAPPAWAGGWHGGGGHSYSHSSYRGSHWGGGYSHRGGYPYGYYGHYGNGSNSWAIAAGITGALFGVAAIADAVTAPAYVAPPATVYQTPPVYYAPAPPPVVYYGPPTVYYGPRVYYYGGYRY